MIDALLWVRDKVMSDQHMADKLAANYPFIDPNKKMILVTGHRRESFEVDLNVFVMPWLKLHKAILMFRWFTLCI